MDFQMNLSKKEAEHRKTMQLLFLIAAGIVQFPFVLVDALYPGWGYFLAEKFLAIPCLLFFGSALCQRLSTTAKWTMLLSGAMILWFAVAQTQHHMNHMLVRNFGIFAVVYLLAFPFAAVTEDEKTGLNWIGWIYTAFSLLLVGFAMMLQLDILPEFLQDGVVWDGARASLIWHPNGTACILMLGIGFSLYFLVQADKKWKKWVMAVLIALQFLTISLTNSRTSIFLTCALIGGTVFFVIWKGGWKRFLAGAAAALAVILALLCIYTALFDAHEQIQIDKLLKEQEVQQKTEEMMAQTAPAETSAETEAPQETQPKKTTQSLKVNKKTGKVTIVGSGSSGQKELSKDMKSLNGRTKIWKAAFTAVQDNPSIKLWGTEYAALEISNRNSFPVVNAHNSWIQIMMVLGLPSLLMALVFTLIAVCGIWRLMWQPHGDTGKKVVAMIVICLLVASILETYLFLGEMPTSFANFAFFLCTGYLLHWNLKKG